MIGDFARDRRELQKTLRFVPFSSFCFSGWCRACHVIIVVFFAERILFFDRLTFRSHSLILVDCSACICCLRLRCDGPADSRQFPLPAKTVFLPSFETDKGGGGRKNDRFAYGSMDSMGVRKRKQGSRPMPALFARGLFYVSLEQLKMLPVRFCVRVRVCVFFFCSRVTAPGRETSERTTSPRILFSRLSPSPK